MFESLYLKIDALNVVKFCCGLKRYKINETQTEVGLVKNVVRIVQFVLIVSIIRGQSHKASKSVNCDSRVVLASKLVIMW